MKRTKIETAIRNSIRRGPSGAQAASDPSAMISAPPMSAKRKLLRMARWPVDLARRYLVGALHAKIDQLHARVDHSQANLDQTRAQVDALTRSLAALHDLTDRKLHQLEIKIRGPLAYDDETMALRTVDGYVLVPKSARHLYVLLADAPAEGLEPGTHRCIKTLLDPGMVAVDVGANVGLLTLACARSVGSRGKVVAFEAEPAYQKLLREMIDLNGAPWIDLRSQAAGAKAGTAQFHVSPIAGHSSLYSLPDDEARNAQTITVDITPLDAALADIPAVDLVKIDVEGAELDVLAGMEGLIARSPDMAIIAEYGPTHLARVGLTPTAWFDAFRRFGFAPYGIDEATGACRSLAVGEAPDVVSMNIAFARPGSRPESRFRGRLAA